MVRTSISATATLTTPSRLPLLFPITITTSVIGSRRTITHSLGIGGITNVLRMYMPNKNLFFILFCFVFRGLFSPPILLLQKSEEEKDGDDDDDNKGTKTSSIQFIAYTLSFPRPLSYKYDALSFDVIHIFTRCTHTHI